MLDAKKKKFVAAILAGANQTHAAKIAGYPEASAYQKGYKLMKDPEIQVALTKKWIKGSDKAISEAVEAMKGENTGENTENSGDLDLNLSQKYDDPIEFLKAAMNNPALDVDQRKDAAKALLPYLHTKKGEGGKKDAKSDAAKKAAARFTQPQPPRLVANNG